MVFGGNLIHSGRHQSIYVPLHEIAQINIAKALYEQTGEHAELEKRLETGDKKWFGLKKRYFEADIVLGNQVWEVKPLNGADPKKQLELYRELGNLDLGNQLQSISDITVLGDIKMDITFPALGEARLSACL